MYFFQKNQNNQKKNEKLARTDSGSINPGFPYEYYPSVHDTQPLEPASFKHIPSITNGQPKSEPKEIKKGSNTPKKETLLMLSGAEVYTFLSPVPLPLIFAISKLVDIFLKTELGKEFSKDDFLNSSILNTSFQKKDIVIPKNDRNEAYEILDAIRQCLIKKQLVLL